MTGADSFSDSFVQSQFPRIFEPSSLADILKKLDKASNRFRGLGYDPSVKLDVSNQAQPADQPLKLVASLDIPSLPTTFIGVKTITREDTAGGVLIAGHRNLFGGAETIALAATKYAKPRQSDAINGEFSIPIGSNVFKRATISGFSAATAAPWASHTLLSKGITAKLSQQCGCSILNQALTEVGVEYSKRIVSELGAAASDAVRADAGENDKYSLFFNWTASKLDDPVFPRNGKQLKLSAEVAGLPFLSGVLPKSDASYLKGVIDCLYARTTADDRVTVNLWGSFGLLSTFGGKSSSIVDRFNFGGYKDIYGFQYNGLGPKSEGDAIGGDAFAAGKVSIYTKLPMLVNSSSPLRFLMFFNGASLVGVDQGSNFSSKLLAPYQKTASTATGVGLAYKTQNAQLELTYVMPLHVGSGDNVRGGLQFGVGLELQ